MRIKTYLKFSTLSYVTKLTNCKLNKSGILNLYSRISKYIRLKISIYGIR